MKLILMLVTVMFISCNNEDAKTYIYELNEVSENKFQVDKNASCSENKYEVSFLKSNCVKEGKFYTCYTDERGNFKLKEFTTKSVCDAEISVKKKENIGLDS